MNILTLENSDLTFIAELQPLGWQDIIPTIDFYTKSNFCLPLKVTIDKKIVGIGTAIVHHDIAWLAHIIVHPDNRNQGIGNLITKTLLENLESKRCDTIYLIGTAMGEPVYKKLGFETETEYVLFKDIKSSGTLKTSENIVPFSDSFKNQISVLDYKVSNENRMFQLMPHLDHGFIYVQDNNVEGYYLPSLGEGLIVSTTTSAGQELMKLRFMTKENASFPMDNLAAIEFMSQNFSIEYKTTKRMRLGKKRNWQPTNIYNRIGGNLG